MAAAFLATAALISTARAGTTVTTYQYNVDGAMTAATTQVDGGDATTTYLTWDDFVPDEGDPTTGTVYAGNGNLLAIGPKPGTGSSLFTFDSRDRLTGFSGADKSAAYGYHANGLMASSTAADSSGFGFYYAGSSMSNLRQTDTGAWSARLGPVRYLDDGSEEVLLTSRKDVAATYDPSSNTVTSYDYDSFGAEEGAPLSSSYDLKDNPHRYAGAYRDPLWGGYYLKARWYDPDLGTFLSRDPAAGFHPYSYGDGNPVMNIDPTGMSTQRAGHATGEKGWSILFNVFVAPLVSIFTKEYWSDVAHNRDQAATFLAAGIVAEIAFGALDYAVVSAAWRGLGASSRWLGQGGVDAGLNFGQAAVSATDGGKFHGTEFAQNLEGLPAGMFYARGLAGLGRRTHVLRGTEVAQRILKESDDTVLVFRERAQLGARSVWSSPVLEAANIGLYHDKLIAVSQQFYGVSRVKIEFDAETGELWGSTKNHFETVDLEALANSSSRYQFVGKTKLGKGYVQQLNFFDHFTRMNPRNHYSDVLVSTSIHEGTSIDEGTVIHEIHDVVSPEKVELPSPFTNNTHHHVDAAISDLRTGPFHLQ